ncbi:MAG: hypothetical protein HeimAB125_21830 [Candidatus Heimdallarchaeota archaeon AB_125]|nr:MAG: hypothetical protein HeimAB125_21830 [Candidatus Heimdallarchaeota archaeon AB_125]
MIELPYLTSILLISIFSLFIAILIVIPNFSKIKQFIWLSSKISLILIFTILVILFVELKTDAYYFLGSFIGVGLLIKGILISNRMSFVAFLASFMSFSFVFLSIGHVVFFVFSLCFSYIFIIGLTVFSLYDSKTEKATEIYSKRFQSISFVTLLVFPILTVYILYLLSENQVIWMEKTSFFSLFYNNYDAIVFIIIGAIFLLLVTILFILDFRTHNKRRVDEPWYS